MNIFTFFWLQTILLLASVNVLLCRLSARKTFTQIASESGYQVQEYDVATQDGYILKLFNIPGNKSRPVLLMHGIIDSADTFIIRGNASLAVTLADAGYDVWLGNSRGSRYSRRHIHLDPDTDKQFWDFSFHELGYYDLPAIIDFVLEKTATDSLSAVGHSQGNSIFLVLGSTRPEYNKKVKVLISLSPVCYLNNLKNFVSHLLNWIPTIDQLYTLAGEEEFLGDNTTIIRVFRNICGYKRSYDFCAYEIFFRLAGADPDEIEPDFLPTVVAHYPTGTSKKNAFHLSQVGIRKSFAQFDYGARNTEIYNSYLPPEYDLNKVTMKVALLVGRNDNLSTSEDVDMLRSKLPNLVAFIVINHKKFNHIDAVWGRNMREYLFPHVMDILSMYG